MADGERRGTGWTNWSGNQAAPAARFLRPESEEDLRTIVLQGQGPLRVVGAGHSFTPLANDAGGIISLDHMGGVVRADAQAGTAVIRAGGRLRDLSPALDAHGLAFRNLGDINVQSFAGAASTATHGTGETLKCLSAEIYSVRMITADGRIVEASESSNPDLLKAAQVSLGALGILLEATVRLCPAYKLRRRTWVEPIETILEAAPERWARHRSYEFFYIPFSGYGFNIAHDKTEGDETERTPSEDEAALATLRRLRNLFKWSAALRRRMLVAGLKRALTEDVVGLSWRLLASVRNTRFNEMEYHVPAEAGLEVFKEIAAYVEANRRDVFFPIEVRKTAGDDAWLSPFQGGARISLAVHAAAEDPYDWFFDGVEPICRAAGGRPHWGKLHSLGFDDLNDIYPDFSRFVSMRKDLDPEGRFMTPALARYWSKA